MSSSGDSSANLDLGSGDGNDTLTGITDYLQAGGSPANLLSASFLGLVVAPFAAFGDVVDAIGTFFSEPFKGAGEALGAMIEGIFEEPGELLTAGSNITETALRNALGDGLAGILAFPITLGIVMLALYMVVLYLREGETGDTLPGVPVDVPTDLFGVEEEETIDE